MIAVSAGQFAGWAVVIFIAGAVAGGAYVYWGWRQMGGAKAVAPIRTRDDLAKEAPSPTELSAESEWRFVMLKLGHSEEAEKYRLVAVINGALFLSQKQAEQALAQYREHATDDAPCFVALVEFHALPEIVKPEGLET